MRSALVSALAVFMWAGKVIAIGQPGYVEFSPSGGSFAIARKDGEESVRDSVRKVTSTHTIAGAGYHTLKFRMVGPGLMLHKLVLDLGGVKPSYLGPPDTCPLRHG